MLDALLTYILVAIAAGFVVWRFALSVHLRTRLRHGFAGTPAPCEPEAATHGCGGGCDGCGLAKRPASPVVGEALAGVASRAQVAERDRGLP